MNSSRSVILQITVLVLFVALALQLFNIQVLQDRYKDQAANNVLRYEVQFPPRGEIYDRRGEFLVQSKESYDLMMVPANTAGFDTLLLAQIAELSPEELTKQIKKAWSFSRRRPSVIVKQMTKEQKLRFEERRFPGFFTQYRTVRSYPRKIGGNLMGYVGEVNDGHIQCDDYYRSGDYVGMSGIELSYETILRGRKGIHVNMVDVHGISQGSYQNGLYDTMAVPGTSITCTIDASLQAFGEELLKGKVGSIVAIEPATGEVLIMASSPSYDPDELVGRERGNNYMKLLNNKRRPLFNRTVMSRYPPGSTFKLVNGLIGQQEKVLTPQSAYPCYSGYAYGNRKLGCHNHYSPLNLQAAVQNSCNAYFCYVFRNIVDNPKYGGVKNGYAVWEDYVRSFGFGRSLESDFEGELPGYVPPTDFYNKRYRGRWNSLTVVSLSIGQGELGCTPLQMANLAATVANRGYYYPPHIVSRIHDRDSIDQHFYTKHISKVEPRYFDPIVAGMYDAVHKPGGTALVAQVPGLDICGKTGTAQNPRGADHSTFLCFAPKDNPKIAVSVYIEHGRFGATVAAPIASLIVEKYLTYTIRRPDLVQYIKGMQIAYPAYDR
ncbi:MAG: penicillin-binding protein 2 [Rikenellaceae bacterium]|jgi:penicillin-binding protein 2|nr:penicillin-binding protein 2 [Rikenellaceae bacterium]